MAGEKKIPIRSCVSCRVHCEKKKLIRIVRSPDGQVRIDPTGKAPGRGAYLCGSKECTVQAIKKNKLSKALRCEVPESLKTELLNLSSEEEAAMATGNAQ
ncbi:MAG: YlxR family protein [Armatimonadota bacterium]|nr:YlxR family protein [Armatimonadota bacterium]